MNPHGSGEVLSRGFLLSLLAVMSALSTADAQTVAAGNSVPKVVVNILIDQLRADYINAYMPLYGEGGFKRLFRQGRVYTRAEYPLEQTDLASAAATLSAGTVPYDHGVVGRMWLDRNTLRPVFCVDDAKYLGTGGAMSGASPASLMVSTLSDELKISTEGKALVYSIAPFREAAIYMGGHAADGAVWIDPENGQWSSSTYYGALPQWAELRNLHHPIADAMKSGETVSASASAAAAASVSPHMKKAAAKGTTFGVNHKFKGEHRFSTFLESGMVNGEIAAAVDDCLNGTEMGRDEITDYLAVTLYAGRFAEAGKSDPLLIQDTYVRLDDALARMIAAVEQRVGADNALFVVSSTGYEKMAAMDPAVYRIPSGFFDFQRATALLNMYLAAIYGQGMYVDATFGTQIYLNHKLIEDKQINFSELLKRSEDLLLRLSGVKNVFTSQRLQQGAWRPSLERVKAGYHPSVSGDILIEVAPGWHYVNQFTDRKQLVRENYQPFPIIFYGQAVQAEKVETPVTVDYIAPTLSKAMRIRAPNACAHAPLF